MHITGDASQSNEECNEIYRVRSFQSSTKGRLVNRGDSFKRKSGRSGSNVSIHSSGSCPGGLSQMQQSSQGSSIASSLDGDSPSTFRVIVLGSAGVGKTSLIQQFKTSEYMGDETPSLSKSFNTLCVSEYIHLIRWETIDF